MMIQSKGLKATLKAGLFVSVAILATTLASCSGAAAAGGTDVKVGILHSLSGTMSISEIAVKDAELLAIEEINAAGGLLGKKLVPVLEDGKSDWPTFAEKAKKLIDEDKVSVVFGCWTSASRKAVLPVFEEKDHLLFYPVQYEGLEASKNIVYTGAAPNQQILPSVDWLMAQGKTKFFLLGSDYVFPRTANQVIRAKLTSLKKGEVVAEEYTPLGHTEYSTVIAKIKQLKPDAVLNTLNGDSNVAFFKQLKAAGIGPDQIPVMSYSIAEEETSGIGIDNIVGHYAAWNYFQSMSTPENTKFIAAYKAKYGATRNTDDPIEAGYFGVYLYAAAVTKAGSFELDKVREALKGITYQAPEGLVTIDPENNHTYKIVQIGKIRADGQFDIVWKTDAPVKPDPFPDLPGLPAKKVLAPGNIVDR